MRESGPTVQKHACEKCRKAKVRCIVENVAGYGSCKRCAESNAQCVFADLAPRQRRKRTDTRLVALENEVRALRQAYDTAHPNARVCIAEDQPLSATQSSLPDIEDDAEATAMESAPSARTRSPPLSKAQSTELDPIPGYVDQTDLSYNDAIDLLTIFTEKLLPEHPVLSLNESDSFETLRADKPLLLFAMITAASNTKASDVFENLHTRLARTLTDKFVINGEKSMELLQSIHIAEVWYNPPTDLKRLNFYLWIRLASTLATQLGLTWDRLAKFAAQTNTNDLRSQERESIHAALAVYLSVSAVSISLRIPAEGHFTENAHACLNLYSTIESQRGQRLTSWIRLQLIAEDIEYLRQILTNRSRSQNPIPGTVADKVSEISQRLDTIKLTTLRTAGVSFKIYFYYVKCKLYESIMVTDAERVTVTDLFWNCCCLIEALTSTPSATYPHLPTVATARILYAFKVLSALVSLTRKAKATDAASYIFAFQENLQKVKFYLHQVHNTNGHKTARMALLALQSIEDSANELARSFARADCGLDDPNPGSNQTTETTNSNDLETVTSPTLVDTNSMVLHDTSHGTQGHFSSFQQPEAPVWSSTQLADFKLMSMPDLNMQYWLDSSQPIEGWEWSDIPFDPSTATMSAFG